MVGCEVIIDPFARNSGRGTITNDLNPDTSAGHHMHAVDFCEKMVIHAVTADAVLFDPPYSPRQISELYKQIGRTCSTEDTQNAAMGAKVKNLLARTLKPDGISISFGWNSNGFGKTRGFEILQILMVAHGGAHNDTIVTVERKIQK